MIYFFLFFLISGLCSVMYEIVWLRLAMANFGVTTAMVSIVLSTFMAGLGAGSWLGGWITRKYKSRISPLRLYALTELLIGVSAFVVPGALRLGRMLLEHLGFSSSGSFYLVSAMWMVLTIVPWSACMGATIPLAMLAIEQRFSENRRSFSFLYVANVLGAVLGAIAPLLLIELYGFRATLKIGAILNALLALCAFALTLREFVPAPEVPKIYLADPNVSVGAMPLALLFATGLTSMGMEVVWIRQFTPYVGTMVYAFAAILALYLLATFIGSNVYRRVAANEHSRVYWAALGFASLLPLIAADPRRELPMPIRLVLGILLVSALFGFLTPMLVDRWSQGNPNRAGRAYAVNVVGCIVGPPLAAFVLLPLVGERWALCVLALPWLVIGLSSPITLKNAGSYVLAAASILLVVTSTSYEDQYVPRKVMRDHTATVVAFGSGMGSRLLVNGVGMTVLTPITKMMAHLPLAFLNHQPRSALVVCFGMGTTFRSLLSWGISTTAVELAPSVPRMFPYYHSDGPQLMESPLSNIVIDDGRRYLERTTDRYDVITIDPPPPIEAAGSSLLYSKEFYSIIKRRLAPGGILQQWLPDGDDTVRSATAKAIKESFPYVRLFKYSDNWGFHILASNDPLPHLSAQELAARLPASAQRDLVEWGPEPTAERQFAATLNREAAIDWLIERSPRTPAMRDDRPVNEYFLLRSWRDRHNLALDLWRLSYKW